MFLTAGNHDGYVATGHVPHVLDQMLGHFVDWASGTEEGTLKQTVSAAEPKAWPNFDWNAYARFLDATKSQPGGRHVDLFGRRHRRLRVDASCTDCLRAGWAPVADEKRNYVLYYCSSQWQP